jgi:5-methylcytosine-specific restriction endonuclease McrA
MRFYGSPLWKRTRKAQLARERRCCVGGGPAIEVDHIVPLSEGGARTDASNLRSVCRHDHVLMTAAAIARRKAAR